MIISNLFRKKEFNFPDIDLGINYDSLKETAQTIQEESMELLNHISQIKKNTEKFNKIYNNVTECIIQIDPNCKIIDSNIHTQYLLGYTKKDILHKNIMSIIDGSDHEEFKWLLLNCNGKSSRIKIMGKTSNFITDIKLISLYVNENTINYIVIIKDVTNVIEQQKTIVEKEAKYKTLCESILDGIVSHKDGVIIDANIQAVEILGFDRKDELIGKQLTSMIDPKMVDSYNKILTSTEPQSYTINYIGQKNKQGQVIPLEIRSNYIGNGTRIGTIRDLTVEMPKIQTNKWLEKTLDECSDSIIVTDKNGMINYANKTFLEKFKFSLPNIVNNKISILFQNFTSWKDMWTASLKGQKINTDTIVIDHEGCHHKVNMSITALSNGNPNSRGSFVIIIR